MIQFTDADGKRRTIRLGKTTVKTAENIRFRGETLQSARVSGDSIDNDTAKWIRELHSELANKLAAVGLIAKRKNAGNGALGAFVDLYVEGREGLKPNTLRNYQQTRRHLLNYFGAQKTLANVTPGDADLFKEHLTGKGLSSATISREVKRARQFFRAAVRQKLILENPFADVKGGTQENESRFYFVSHEEAEKVLGACPDGQWRLIFALSRYGGLRCPSEHLALRWGDVDWENKRFTVRSPKTEHNPGGESRVVPMFPELRPHFESAFDEAEPGTEYVITRYRNKNSNLRTQLLRIIAQAGLTPWAKLFQNLRSTRETELTETFPLHVVVKWLGNSQQVASKHYLQVTNEHFEQAAKPLQQGMGKAVPKALHNALQSTTETPRKNLYKKKENLVNPEGYEVLQSGTCTPVPPRGVEPLSSD